MAKNNKANSSAGGAPVRERTTTPEDLERRPAKRPAIHPGIHRTPSRRYGLPIMSTGGKQAHPRPEARNITDDEDENEDELTDEDDLNEEENDSDDDGSVDDDDLTDKEKDNDDGSGDEEEDSDKENSPQTGQNGGVEKQKEGNQEGNNEKK